MMLPGIVTRHNIEDDVTRHNIEGDAISLSWFALACLLTDAILLSTKSMKYSNYQGSIPDEFLLR